MSNQDILQQELSNIRADNHLLRTQLEMFGELSMKVSEHLEPEAVLQDIVDAACELTDAQYGAVAVFDEEGRITEFITHGVNDDEREAIGEPPKGLGLLGWLHDIQRPARLPNISTHPRSVGFPDNHPPMSSFLGVPLQHGDTALGTLYLTEKHGADFTPEDEQLTVMFAAQAAMAIHNARRFQGEQRALTEARDANQALAESEHFLQSIMDNAQAVVFVKDAEGGYITINQRYEELFEVRRDEVRGKTDHDLHPSDVAEALLTNDMRVLSSNEPMEFEETVPSNGSLRTYLSVKFPLRNADGEPYAVCGIATDITERKEVEQMKADFLSMISHDLRGPLTTIKGMSSSLLMEGVADDTETVLDYINSIDEEADRMAELVGNLLDMSRIEARSMPLEPEECHLADIVTDAVRNIERSRTSGGREVASDIPLDLPGVYADYDQIGRVLNNLLSNAIKYSPEDTRVSVRSYLDPENPGLIVTAVEDQGVGIPPDEMDKIFDKFYRVSSHLGRGRPGSGLGLAICKSIVEAHDGSLWVDSEPGAGSTFYFTLPASVSSVAF